MLQFICFLLYFSLILPFISLIPIHPHPLPHPTIITLLSMSTNPFSFFCSIPPLPTPIPHRAVILFCMSLSLFHLLVVCSLDSTYEWGHYVICLSASIYLWPQFLLAEFCSFHCSSLCSLWLIPKDFIFWCYYKWSCFCNFLFRLFIVLVEKCNFCILSLHPATLLKSFINSNSLFCGALGPST